MEAQMNNQMLVGQYYQGQVVLQMYLRGVLVLFPGNKRRIDDGFPLFITVQRAFPLVFGFLSTGEYAFLYCSRCNA